MTAAAWAAGGLVIVCLLTHGHSSTRGARETATHAIAARGIVAGPSVSRAVEVRPVTVTRASFRRVSPQDTGTIRLRLRNASGRTLRAPKWCVNGASLELARLLGDPAAHRDSLELLHEDRSDASAVSPATSNKHELYSAVSNDAAIWAWGTAAWGLPPGESDLVLKLARPPQGSVRVEGTFDGGELVRVDVAPVSPQFVLSYVATDPEQQRMYVYAENRGTSVVHPTQCRLDGSDVTADATFASRSVEPGGKACWVIELRKRPQVGELKHVRLITAEGVEAAAPAKVFGSLVLAPSESALGEGLHVLSVCPTHAYGSLASAAVKMLRDRADRERRGEAGLFGLQVCSGGKGPIAGRDRQFRFGYDVRALFVFGETGDFLVLNPLVDWPFCGPWSEEYGTVVSWRTAMARRAAEPGPVFTLLLDRNAGQPGDLRRPFSADEIRYLAWCELAGGSKGLVQRQDGPTTAEVGARDQVFHELAPVRRLIAIGDGIAGTTADHPDFEAKAICAGPDGMAVILLNHAHEPGWVVRDHPVTWRLPRRPVSVDVPVPDGLRVNEVLDIRTGARLRHERTTRGIRFSTATQTPASCFVLRMGNAASGGEVALPAHGIIDERADPHSPAIASDPPIEVLPRTAGFGLVSRRPVSGPQPIAKPLELVNWGKRAITIEQVTSSSPAVSCESSTRAVPAGGRLSLAVVADVSRLTGKWLETLSIQFRAGDHLAPIEVPVAGATLPGVVWEPRQLYFGLDLNPHGQIGAGPVQKQVRIWDPDSLDFIVTSVSAQPVGRLVPTSRPGSGLAPAPWDITLRPGAGGASLGPGDYEGTVRLNTSDPQCPCIEVPYELAVWR